MRNPPISVQAVIERLAHLPPTARVRAYEGEDTGIVVETEGGVELDFIRTP